ncbi:MAG: hypothetical protein ACW97O_04820 [Candidatus Thorarchaeota archaeon]|jgi:hypothetical protein
MTYAGSTAAVPATTAAASSPVYFTPSAITSQEPENGTYVWWNQDSNSTSEEWTWNNRNWLFGPRPSFEIFHSNGSLLTKDSYAEIGDVLRFVVTVPMGVFTQDADIGRVQFYGWYMTQDYNYSANFDFTYDDWSSDPWMAWSNQWNYTDQGGTTGPGDPIDPIDPLDPPEPMPSFIDIYPGQCSITSDPDAYYLTFAVSFNAETPLGLYELNMNVEDDQWNWIGSYNYGSGWEFTGIAVGMHADMAWATSYGGSYTLQKLDMAGDDLYSVARGTDFTMRFNISGDLEYAMLGFRMPHDMYVTVNVTGWHDELVTTTGGWEYDNLLQTYIWNASKQVTYMQQVFGPYEQRQYTSLGISDEVNVTVIREDWNNVTMTWDKYLANETCWVERQFFYIYNQTTASFETYYGYTYYGYPHDYIINEWDWNEEIMVLEPIPAELPVFFELNTTLSTAQMVNNELVVDFVGHFTDKMPKTGEGMYFEFFDRVIGPDNWFYGPATYGERPRQTESEYQMARRITIETPVTIARLLKSDGSEPSGWMFQADKGDPFKVRGRLQGGSDIANDIDAASLMLRAYDGYWTEEEYGWSELTYEIEMSVDGTPRMRAFNFTEKHNYTWGTYMDYVYSNVTGWHDEYSEDTNTWEWTYGDYQEWVWTEVDGWHWQWWYYNQLTGEWQTEHTPYQSPETEVAADFCTTSGFSTWSEGGDFFLEFDVVMAPHVPDTNYWWEFAFMNSTWFEDYSSSYGEHEVLSWDREWVYSFDYFGDEVYMDPVVDNQLAFFNGTLSSDFMIGKESPYIVIDNEKLPIKVRENFDPCCGTTWTEMFFYSHMDPATGKDVYFYELVNGTKIFVSYTDVVYIYNVTSLFGDSFLTAMRYDWGWYDGTNSYSYWIDIDGGIHQGGFEYYWSNSVIELYDKVEIDYNNVGHFMRYGTDKMLNVSDWYWNSRDGMYYVEGTDSNLYQMVWNETDYYYYLFIEGKWQICSWPERYYLADFEGSDAMLFTYDQQRFWFHESEGIKYEMPYPDANAPWHFELSHTISEGGYVPTTKSLIYNDNAYPVYNISMDYFVDIAGTTYSLNMSYVPHSVANGTDIWNPLKAGVEGVVGNFDNELLFSEVEKIQYYTTDMMGQPRWDSVNGYYVIDLFNGTTWIANYSYAMLLNEYDYSGETFYSAQDYPYYYEEIDGSSSWYEYCLINGTYLEVPNFDSATIISRHVVYTYDSPMNGTVFDFMSQTYPIYYWGMNVWGYTVHNATYSGTLFLNMQMGGHDVLQFDYLGTPVTATASFDNIERMRQRWGYNLVYGPAPIQSDVYKNFYDLIIGVPEWGMWGLKNWDVNPENGALDLDGNLDTEDDQYFIQEQYTSTDSWTHTWDRMDVHITWDPNGTIWGDEMNVYSWLGLDIFSWTYEWSQTFYWYTSDMVPLDAAEMQNVKDTLLTAEGDAQPGYWDISQMAKNVTWADLVAEAELNGWDWITSNEQTWTWMSFGVGQEYGTSYDDFGTEHWLRIGMHYEYSGLMIWEDLNDNGQMDVDLFDPGVGELSHYLIPDSVGSVGFVTPGQAYGNTDSYGNMHLDLLDEVTWGVNFYEINGTSFPFTLDGYWGWYDGFMTGSDLRGYDERPTQVIIDELSFLVHFQGYIDEESLNNYADIKVDNYVGNWDVDMIGGRDNLENRSLALNYFADVNMHDFAFKAEGSVADNEMTVSADVFEFETATAQFAKMIMGGVTYDWGKNTSAPYDVVSYTTPVGTFRAAFESDSGQSATAWSFGSNMFYVTIGFPQWDGYSVYQDPVFVSYVSRAGAPDLPEGMYIGPLSLDIATPTATDTVTIRVDVYSETEPVYGVDLMYGTDGENWWSDPMWKEGEYTYVGTIPPFEDQAEVYYMVMVHTESGDYQSQVSSYIVGGRQTTYPTGFGLDMDMLMLLGGGGFVLAMIGVLVRRRRRSHTTYEW